MLKAFCTIITLNYLPYARALHDSLIRFGAGKLVVLISDKVESELSDNERKVLRELPDSYYVLFYDQVVQEGIGNKIFSKYWGKDMDCFRWSMKPVLIEYLFRNSHIDKILYLDCDLYFYSDPGFLFQELDSSNVLLTPHWRSSDPALDPANFQLLFTGGLYNAGFVGVNRNGLDCIKWWAETCERICVKDLQRGFFVDQTHLNLFPILFDGVMVLKHRGCNIANWNLVDCKRVKKEDGRVLINNEYPVVFIHFTGSTVCGILKQEDTHLLPYLQEYEQKLEEYGIDKINCLRMKISKEDQLSDVFTSNQKMNLSQLLKRNIKKVFAVLK